MPLQNRVDPFGNLICISARGTMMGNRGGALHNLQREIVRDYKSRRWITCVLEFRGRRRVVMSPNRYTELFFLDEATAFSAGHRPCAECRRERFNAFRSAWQRVHRLDRAPSADEMDLELHRQRLEGKRKATYAAELASLPDGCFVERGGNAFLVWGDRLLRWSPSGYTSQAARGKGRITVLTPKSIVECFRQGYRPEFHETGAQLLVQRTRK